LVKYGFQGKHFWYNLRQVKTENKLEVSKKRKTFLAGRRNDVGSKNPLFKKAIAF
jgi:hypothetical protein